MTSPERREQEEKALADHMRTVPPGVRRAVLALAAAQMGASVSAMAALHDIGETFDSPKITRLLALAAEIRDLSKVLGVEGAPQ